MADWTAISGYTPQDYTDTAVFEVDSETKKIALITGQPLVAGEENAQYMRFVLDRYWDGIDIKDKDFYIEYALAGTYYGKTAAVNAEYTTEQIRFGWIVPKEACCISGTLLFVLRIESEDYVLKTQIAEHPVFKSVNVEDVVPEPTKEAWYIEFEARVDNAISEAETAISTAQAVQTAAEIAAQNAQTAEANAEAAAATAQTTAEIAAQEAVNAWADEHEDEIVNGYVTPEMFGAKGDGVTDDTTAIQRAVDSGKDVFLSQGTYLIGGTVVIQNDVVLFGCGFNSVLKITGKITTDNAKHNINLHDFTVFASKSNGNAVEIIATNNALADNTLNITGVYFEFDNTVTNSTATMLYLYGVRESMISNCVFFGSDYNYPSGSIGLKAEADSTHLTMNINISGCAFSYLGSAIYLNGSDGNRIYLAGFRIINNTIIGCGYGVRTYYFDTPMISNNMIDYCEYPIYCESSTNITIDNNYIQTAHSGGCLYIINTSSAACDIINIFDNIIHSSNGSTAGSEITDGIVLEGGTSPVVLRHVNIKGNFIFRVKTAINLAGTQFANISNNQVFYATTFVDGNNSSDYTKLFDNYVQTDVSNFCVNKKDTWKITDNQWGSKHTNGTLTGTLEYSVAANSSVEYNVSFNGLNCVFYDVPAVNVYFKDVGTSWQDMFIAITSVSTSGFTVKIVNASGTVHSNVVGWSAILA